MTLFGPLVTNPLARAGRNGSTVVPEVRNRWMLPPTIHPLAAVARGETVLGEAGDETDQCRRNMRHAAMIYP